MAPKKEDESAFVTLSAVKAAWEAVTDLLGSPSLVSKAMGAFMGLLFLLIALPIIYMLLFADVLILMLVAPGLIQEAIKDEEQSPHITAHPKAGAASESGDPRAAPKQGGLRCAYCHGDLGEVTSTCPECGTVVHVACAAESAGCPTLGCSRAAPPRHHA